ncbi:8405_t:CDS:2 [Diversispora eburnea]|uniref:8405_t:CDS:1 n=1 Tax=Diversispora eburnea TaxID=1213867 RepID=A0A9N8W295_9GLOM|nr:8405_t:CDS:2 [Diversispora eburnea]
MTSINSEYLLQELSTDLHTHLKSSNDYDVLIQVGQGLRLRNFKVHSVILRARSLYFRSIQLSQYFASDILDLIVTANEFCLPTLISCVQDHLIKNESTWLHQNLVKTLHIDIKQYTNQDFSDLKNTLEKCIPLIRFYQISAKDFYKKIRSPFKKILSEDLNENILQYHMDPESIGTNLMLPRGIHCSPLQLFSSPSSISETSDSFLFTFNFTSSPLNSSKLSRIEPCYVNRAIYLSNYNGPCFGESDLHMLNDERSWKCEIGSYKESIFNDSEFLAEDYEVFQVVYEISTNLSTSFVND